MWLHSNALNFIHRLMILLEAHVTEVFCLTAVKIRWRTDFCFHQTRDNVITTQFCAYHGISFAVACNKKGLREVSRTFAIRHSMANVKSLTFDVWSYLAIQIQLFIFWRGRGHDAFFLGGQRYFERNSSNSRWNASYVDGICQAVSSDIPERSCSSFGRGKVMISFLGPGKTSLCV